MSQSSREKHFVASLRQPTLLPTTDADSDIPAYIEYARLQCSLFNICTLWTRVQSLLQTETSTHWPLPMSDRPSYTARILTAVNRFKQNQRFSLKLCIIFLLLCCALSCICSSTIVAVLSVLVSVKTKSKTKACLRLSLS